MTTLVTTLGARAYEETDYFLSARRDIVHRTRFAPLATATLVGGVTQAWLLLTREAEEKHWLAFREESRARGIDAHLIPIGKGENERELLAVFESLADVVEENARVVVDITNALRHLPVIMLAALGYLRVERGVRIDGVYYGAFEAKADNRTPIFDLSAFLTLSDAFHAVAGFRESGDARRLAGYIRELNARCWRAHEGNASLGSFADALEAIGRALAAGLTLAAGLAARKALDNLGEAREQIVPRDPIAASLAGVISPVIERAAVGAGVRNKTALRLDLDELRRQFCIIRFYLDDAQAVDRAIVLLREWVVSRVLLAAGRADRWLDRRTREGAERRLAMLDRRVQAVVCAEADGAGSAAHFLTERQRTLQALWSTIAAHRNRLAHPDMCEDDVRFDADGVRRLVRQCEDLVAIDDAWRIGASEGQHLLVTPLGLSPGVLYTALVREQPDVVLIVTSPAAAARIGEVCRNAGFDEARVTACEVGDPHTCYLEAEKLVQRENRVLLAAGRLTANVTGGTTALQCLVERLAREAGRLGISVRRIALVDRRAPDEQQRHPYVAGDVLEIDKDDGWEG